MDKGRDLLGPLKVFCDVARHRSFSQAAAANHLSQPAASLIVRQLEKRLGVQLVNRLTRPLQLTELGQTYYEGCKDLVDQYLELEASIRRAKAERAGAVHVAAIYSVGLGDMGRQVECFEALHPHVKVQVEYLHPDRVYEKVLTGIADFGLVSFPRRSRELQVEPWREEAMVLACWPGHPLTRRRSVAPAQLAGEKYVGFEKGLTIRRMVDRFLREHGAVVEIVAEFDNIENIKKAIQVQAGVAVLPAPTLHQEVEAGTLAALPLEGRPFVRPLGVIRRRQLKPGAAALHFIDLLRGVGEDAARAARSNGNGKADGPNGQPHATRRTR
jgi:DNA-binding transcriptional LysR family regulator